MSKKNILIIVGSNYRHEQEFVHPMDLDSKAVWDVFSIDIKDSVPYQVDKNIHVYRYNINTLLQFPLHKLDKNAKQVFVMDGVSCGGIFKDIPYFLKALYHLGFKKIFYTHYISPYNDYPTPIDPVYYSRIIKQIFTPEIFKMISDKFKNKSEEKIKDIIQHRIKLVKEMLKSDSNLFIVIKNNVEIFVTQHIQFNELVTLIHQKYIQYVACKDGQLSIKQVSDILKYQCAIGAQNILITSLNEYTFSSLPTRRLSQF